MKWVILFLLTFSFSFAQNKPFKLYKKETSIGDTLLVIGGIHGNEPGGYFSASVLATHYKISKGNLWVVPNLNFESLLRNSRGIYGDMNRKFDKITKDDKDYDDVIKIKEIILSKEVDFITNLHDGRGFYREHSENSLFNPSAWGQAFIVDQKKLDIDSKYNNLDIFLPKVQNEINKDLSHNHHVFNLKNTKTKEKDEQMQQSLTYFAITNGKPAIAIETSKNIDDLVLKVKYQLVAIENIMKAMGIEFQRDFDIYNKNELFNVVHDHMSITINDRVKLSLNGIRDSIYYFPLKKEDNNFQFVHPLGAVIKNGDRFDVMIGNERITSLYPQYFEYTNDKNSKKIYVDNDGEIKEIDFTKPLLVKNYFEIKDNNYRVNIIGFSKENIDNESNIKVGLNNLMNRFSVDDKDTYRIEFYDENKYFNTLFVKFKGYKI